jgi:hypothetical protein
VSIPILVNRDKVSSIQIPLEHGWIELDGQVIDPTLSSPSTKSSCVFHHLGVD